MAADIIRPLRDHQQSSELHRWAMLRIAVNEDKCTSLTSKTKKHKKKTRAKEADELWSSLFRNLPTLTTVRKWRAMVGGDVRRKYGGRTEWDSCLTDSAYLMYGIPRAKLRQDVIGEMKGRHNGTGPPPRRVNYSQSFSSFDFQRDPSRHVVQVPRIPSNPSMGSRPKSAISPVKAPTNGSHLPTAPVKPVRHIQPHPMPKPKGPTRCNEGSTPVNHVRVQPNGIVEALRYIQPHPMPKPKGPTRCNVGSTPVNHAKVQPNGIVETLRHIQPHPMPKPKGPTRYNEGSTPVNNVRVQPNGIVETPRRVNYSQSFSSFDCRQDLQPRVLQMPRIPSNLSLANALKSVTPIPPASSKSPAAPPPVAPAIPVRNRPPHPMPKPKKTTNDQGLASNKYNLTSLQVALMGSLNKRLKAQSSKHQPQS